MKHAFPRTRIAENWSNWDVSQYALRMFFGLLERHPPTEGGTIYAAMSKAGTLAYALSPAEASMFASVTVSMIGDASIRVTVKPFPKAAMVDALRESYEHAVSRLEGLL